MSLLESWALASSLPTFKLAWKTATLLALLTAKQCSDLTLLCVGNQHLFFSIMLQLSFPYLLARRINQVIILLRFTWVSFLCYSLPCFLFEGLFELRHTEPFRKKPDGSHVTSLFLVNNRQHRLACAKTISSCVRKVLCVAKAHMSLGSLLGTTASAALAAGVSLVSILKVGDWARISTPARQYFSTYITTMDWHQDSVQYAVLGLSE